MNNTYLAHHGILGMKWGARRSEAQLARARGHSSKSSDDKNEVSARKVAVKNRRTMSDADLKKRIERLKLEREFKNLTEDDIAPGRKYVSEILSASAPPCTTHGYSNFSVRCGWWSRNRNRCSVSCKREYGCRCLP